MKEIYWPEFETTLRRKVSEQIAHSPELLSEVRKRKLSKILHTIQIWSIPGVGLLWMWKIPVSLFEFAATSTARKIPIWALITMIATGISFCWAAVFRRQLQESHIYQGLCGVPVPDSVLFNLIWRGSDYFQVLLFIGFGIPVFGALSPSIQESLSTHNLIGVLGQVLLGIGISALFLLATRALTLWFVYHWSTLISLPRFLTGFGWTLLVLGIQVGLYPSQINPLPEDLFEFSTLIFPAGWVGYAFHHSILNSEFQCLFAFIPICLFIGHKTQRIQHLCTTFSLETRDWFLPLNLSDSLKPTFPFEGLAPTKTNSDLGSPPPAQPDAGLMAVQVRQTLFNPGFDLTKEGWVERLSARFLTRSEQHLLEFMFGSSKKSNWTKLWWTGLISTILVCACLINGPQLLRLWEHQIHQIPVKHEPFFDLLTGIGGLGAVLGGLYSVAAIFLFCFSTAIADWWQGFQPHRTSEKTIPIHAVYPTGFWPILRIQWKLSLIRLVLSFPALVFLSIGINSVFKLSPGIGIELAVKIVCILLATLFVGMMDGFSRTTTGSFISLFKLINVGGTLLTLGGVFSLGYLAVRGSTWEFARVWLVFISLMFLWLMVFGKLYNRGKVDLLQKAA